MEKNKRLRRRVSRSKSWPLSWLCGCGYDTELQYEDTSSVQHEGPGYVQPVPKQDICYRLTETHDNIYGRTHYTEDDEDYIISMLKSEERTTGMFRKRYLKRHSAWDEVPRIAATKGNTKGQQLPKVHQKEETGNIYSAEKELVSSLATNLSLGIKRDCTNNQFLDLERNVDVEFTHKSGNRYSIHFPAAGFYLWPATGLGFVVRGAVTVEMALASWSEHLDLALQHHEQWMVAGPLFDITAEPGEAIAEIHLPHFISLQAGEVDVAWFQIAHFKDEGMVLEQPARVEPSYAVLGKPSFSLMGILLRIAHGTRLSVPITSTTLVYYHTHPEETKFHLYLIPSDASLTKAIDEEEATFHGVRLQTSPPLEPLNFGSRYIVSGSAHLEIMPKELKLSYRSPGEIQPFSKVYAGQMKEKIQLEITNKRHGTLIWKTLVKPGAAFVKEHLRNLQARMGDLSGVLDDLQDCEVLTENEKELVQQAQTRQKRNETLLRLVENKGDQALEKLYRSLSERDPYLVTYLRQPRLSP